MNSFYLLQSLRAVDALWILSDAAGRDSKHELGNVRVKIFIPPDTPHLPSAMLIVPSGPSATNVLKAYRARTGIQTVSQVPQLPSDSDDLHTGIARLVALPRIDDQAAETAEHDYLVIAVNSSLAQAQSLLRLIASYATQVSFTTATIPQAPDQPATSVYLYHVIADRTRNESFSSLVRPQIRHLVLQGYKVDIASGKYLVFADEGYPPGRKMLTAFATLVQAAPEYFPASSQPLDGTSLNRSLLAAFAPRLEGAAASNGSQPSPTIDILNLRQLQFSSQVTLARPVVPPSEVRFLNLQADPARMAALRETIERSCAEQDVSVGYHLRLRTTTYVVNADRERQRLLEQKEQIEQRLEYLDGTERQRPKLLRFTHEQLPALADFIRSFPMRLLNSQGPLRYAFQSTGPDGTGVHFLLVDSHHAPQTSIDPLPYWEHHGDPIIRFWLDPFWARYYLGEGEELIYVPEGTHLLPVMHAPSRQEMSSYMRAVMQRWCRPEYGVPSIPKQPIYLFEPHPAEPTHLVIAVLDAQAFRPLTERLEWLNRHLHIRHAQQRGADILTKLSDVLTGDDLLARLDEQVSQRQDARQHIFSASASRVDQAAAHLTSLLTSELQDVLRESQETLGALRTAREHLAQLYRAKAQVEGLQAQMTTTITQTRAASDATAKETDQLNAEVQAQAKLAESAHDDARRRILRLEDLYAQLCSLLKSP